MQISDDGFQPKTKKAPTRKRGTTLDRASSPSAEINMSQTIQHRNKALVLEAFDTLFNKRDYAAAERFWSPH
jgi:hypothetical protein